MSDDSSVLVPPMLYVAARSHPEGGQTAIICETADGRRALMAYTALDRLVHNCGDRHPWMLVPLQNLERIMSEQPFDIVAFDVRVPEAYRATEMTW